MVNTVQLCTYIIINKIITYIFENKIYTDYTVTWYFFRAYFLAMVTSRYRVIIGQMFFFFPWSMYALYNNVMFPACPTCPLQGLISFHFFFCFFLFCILYNNLNSISLINSFQIKSIFFFFLLLVFVVYYSSMVP